MVLAGIFSGYVTLTDLGIIAVFFVIVVAGVFLIRALAQLGNSLRAINKLIKNNSENIDKVIKDLPAISGHASSIAENAVTLTEQATELAEGLLDDQELVETALENVGGFIEEVADTARAINEDLLGGIKRLAGTISTVVKLLAGKRAGTAETGGGSAKKAPGARIADSASGGTPSSPSGATPGSPEGEGIAGVAAADGTAGAGNADGRRGRATRKRRKRSASAVSVRKKQADKGRDINIHIS